MAVKTLLDNWTLQNAGELLHGHRDFRSVSAHWVPLRELLADQLSECAQGIRRQHEENKDKYRLLGRSSDEMLSQVV